MAYQPLYEGQLIALTVEVLQQCLRCLDRPELLDRSIRLVEALRLDLEGLQVHLESIQHQQEGVAA